MKNLKNKIKYFIIAIVVLLLGAAVYVNVFSPLIVGEKYIEVEELDATEYSDTYFLDLEKRANGIKNGRSGLGEGTQALRTGDKLPSYEMEDYVCFNIFVNVTNLSFFEQAGFHMYFEASEDSRIIVKESCFVTERLKGCKNRDIWMAIGTLYRGDLTDEELEEYISRQKVKLRINNSLRGDIDIDMSLDGAKIVDN